MLVRWNVDTIDPQLIDHPGIVTRFCTALFLKIVIFRSVNDILIQSIVYFSLGVLKTFADVPKNEIRIFQEYTKHGKSFHFVVKPDKAERSH
jgi:hypothetical protein